MTVTDEDRAIIDAVNAPTMMASPFYDPILRGDKSAHTRTGFEAPAPKTLTEQESW